MVFEPNFVKVASSVRKNLGITQSVIELKLPTNEDIINTIYSVSARSTIVTSEVVGNDINFTGLVDFQAMFESDGVSAFDYSAEFKDKYISNEELRGEVVLTSNVVDVTSSIVSNGIKVVAIVEVTIDIITTQDVNVLTNISGDEVFLSSKAITYNTFVGKASEKFDVSEEFDIARATKILMVTPNVCLGRVTPNENFATISGSVNVDICYQNGDNNNDIQNLNKSFDFDYDVALSGIESDSYIQSSLSIVMNEIKVSTMIAEDGANVSLYVPLIYNGYIFNQNTIDVIDDVYSMQNYLSITNENFDSLVGFQSSQLKDTISGSATIMDSAPFIDDVLGVCTNNIVLASSRVVDDRLCIEGVANATVVYYTKESGLMTAVQVEMPFAVEEKVEGDVSSTVTLSLTNVVARSKRGKEIEVSGDLCIYTDMYSQVENCVISNIVLGEEKPKDDCSLYIYMVKPNDTLWSIAKEMNTSESAILEQNNDIELPLKGGEKLVIYKPTLIGY